MMPDGISVVRNLLKLGALLQREGDRMLREFGLTQQQFVVLKEVEERGPVSHKDICRELLYEKSNVSRVSAKLSEMGLLETRPSEDDARICLLMVTRQGRKVAHLAMRILDKWDREFTDGLAGSEIARLSGALGKLAAKK